MSRFEKYLQILSETERVQISLGSDEDEARKEFNAVYKSDGYHFTWNGKKYFAEKSASPKPKSKEPLTQRDRMYGRSVHDEGGSLGS